MFILLIIFASVFDSSKSTDTTLFTNAIPADYPVVANGDKITLNLNSTTLSSYSMATPTTGALHLQISNIPGNFFRLKLKFHDFSLQVLNDKCVMNGQTKFLNNAGVHVKIDLSNRKVVCNDQILVITEVSEDDYYALFNVSITTNAAINCTIPKEEIVFPSPSVTMTTAPTTSLSTTTPTEKENTGISQLSIVFIVVGCVAVVLIIAAITLGVFLCKRKKVLCFKKAQPRPWYLPSPSQDVEGTPSKYTCRAGQRKRETKRSESKDTVNTFDSVEQEPSKIKLYKDGEYANIILDSTATAISIQKTPQKSIIQP